MAKVDKSPLKEFIDRLAEYGAKGFEFDLGTEEPVYNKVPNKIGMMVNGEVRRIKIYIELKKQSQ